jgi:hypothetical protein
MQEELKVPSAIAAEETTQTQRPVPSDHFIHSSLGALPKLNATSSPPSLLGTGWARMP